VQDEPYDVGDLVLGAIMPCPILRIVSFRIHPVSLSIHLPVFLFSCSSVHLVTPDYFRRIVRHLPCSVRPFNLAV
jgi:hypothetical protein